MINAVKTSRQEDGKQVLDVDFSAWGEGLAFELRLYVSLWGWSGLGGGALGAETSLADTRDRIQEGKAGGGERWTMD